ncbi:MAG: L-aspartate oxidase [Candidatus Meridianibacter frigidus]|nr:MAG: L-aspartate oxidase [Candidatus Eremiobacteraeota bacterium]
MERLRADVAIVGAGIAGLTAALKLAPLQVLVLTKTALGTGAATQWAQGGIAAALGSDDSPALHSADTQASGAGLSDRKIVEILAQDAPARIEDLLALGARFDRTARGELDLGQEGAHRRRRIVHAGGDATGREILETLIGAARNQEHIRIIEDAHAQDLTVEGDRVGGLFFAVDGRLLHVEAASTILATGGVGHIFARTTNPVQACGDGLAMAARARALLGDLEFVQFHPTAIDVGADPMPLATEALRGEGATLIDERGNRFIDELAPRDVVARALYSRLQGNEPTLLDARGIGSRFPMEFPTTFTACMQQGIDPRTRPIPVAPAAHYHMGGIAVDQWGRSSLHGMWACGEVSATGVHGANRLGSNSLLEALVYGTRVATDILNLARAKAGRDSKYSARRAASDERGPIAELRAVMYDKVGIVRSAVGLEQALEVLDRLSAAHPQRGTKFENMLTVSGLIARAALRRNESRGSHYRSDYPDRNDEQFAKRSFSTLGDVA